MKRWFALSVWALATPVGAQALHDHAGQEMSAPTPAAVDPHAGHDMSGHAMPTMTAPSPPNSAPAAPHDWAAEQFHSPQAMVEARAKLIHEHGGGTVWQVMLNTAEVRFRPGADNFAWRGEAWMGGDINRFVVKSEGEGRVGGALGDAEIQALYSRAVSPYFDLQLGLRREVGSESSRSYAVVGLEGLAPYWVETGASAFVSDQGDLTARLEGAYELRLTQALILQPRAELELKANDGLDLSHVELALRLRYHLTKRFAPYVGVVHTHAYGASAAAARLAGDDRSRTALTVGVRTWF